MRISYPTYIIILFCFCSCTNEPEINKVSSEYININFTGTKYEKLYNKYLVNFEQDLFPKHEGERIIVHSNQIQVVNLNTKKKETYIQGDEFNFLDFKVENNNIVYELKRGNDSFIYRGKAWNLFSAKIEPTIYKKIGTLLDSNIDDCISNDFFITIAKRYNRISNKNLLSHNQIKGLMCNSYQCAKKTFAENEINYQVANVPIALLDKEYLPRKDKYVYVQNELGLKYSSKDPSKTNEWDKFAEIAPMVKTTNFVFDSYQKIAENWFAIVKDRKVNKTIWVKLNRLDDFLIKPYNKVNYVELIKRVNHCNDCETIIDGLVYLNRHIKGIKKENNYEKIDLSKISKIKNEEYVKNLENNSSICKSKGGIGPEKEFSVKNNISDLDNSFFSKCNCTYKANIKVRPDPIVRKCYNNMAFLIPAWQRYNEMRMSTTGVKLNEYNEYVIMQEGFNSRQFRVIIPTIENLLHTTDFQDFINYSFQKYSYDPKNIAELNTLKESIKEAVKEGNKAVLLETKRPIYEIAKTMGQIKGITPVQEEKSYDPSIGVVAKILGEKNKDIYQKFNLGSNSFPNNLTESSDTLEKVIVPINERKLGIRNIPLKKGFSFKAKVLKRDD